MLTGIIAESFAPQIKVKIQGLVTIFQALLPKSDPRGIFVYI